MKICSLDADRREEWNALIRQEPSFSLMQAWEWGAFKEVLGWKAVRLAVEMDTRLVAGAQMLIKPLPMGLSLAYVPRGPVGEWQNSRNTQLLFSELCRLARESGAIFMKIEPPVTASPAAVNLLEENGFRYSRVTNQPQATILIDLKQGQAGILQQMRKKTRQYVHRAEREGITVRFGGSEDLPAYFNLMRLTGRREHFATRSLNYYQAEWATLSQNDQGALLLAYHNEKLIAARVVYCFGCHAAEFHGGSIVIPGLHANYLLVWEAIKWAVAKGCITYDMWGIPDEIACIKEQGDLSTGPHEDGLWGVYQFKRGFSRNIVAYIGAYDLVFSPALYFLVNSALSWGKSWERVAAVLDSHKYGFHSELKIDHLGDNK